MTRLSSKSAGMTRLAAEHDARRRSVGPDHAQRQAEHLVHPRLDVSQIQAFNHDRPAAKQHTMRGGAGPLELFDREVIDPDQLDAMIDQMFRVPSLKVMARATVFRFKGTSDPQEAGRKLGVGAVLTGAVSRRGDALSISAELLDVATGMRLWGEKYERPFAELLRVQNSIAAGIADGLHLRLSGEERRALGGHGTANAVAYELALKARYFFLKQTEEGYLEARRLYRLAIEKDPKFADAHLGVAITYGAMVVEGFEPPAEGQARYEEEVRKATSPGDR